MLKQLPYKWFVAAMSVLAFSMTLLDLTITNVALPALAREFRATPAMIAWVSTGYLLSVAVCIAPSGWLGDRFGTKRTFLFALALFTVGSLLCGVAPGLGALIAARVVQGAGGGLLTPVGSTMVLRAFPVEERARASVFLTVPAGVAPALGPVIGGYLVQYHSWHWVFLINVPLGLIGLAVGAYGLVESRDATAGRFDLRGFALVAFGLAATVYALGEVGPRGFIDARVLGFGGIGLMALAAFVLAELRAAAPLIDLRLYRDRLFAAGNLVLFLVSAGLFGVIFLLPQLLQAEGGLAPLASGLATFPTAVGIMIAAPLAGRLYPLVGPRRLVMAGAVLSVGATLALCLIDLSTNLWQVRLQMLPLGIAFGIVFIPIQTAGFANISPVLTGRATAAYNAVRQVASASGTALLATILSASLTRHGAVFGGAATRAGAVAAFHDTFAAAALLGLLALVAAVLIDDRLAARTMVRAQEPRAEPAAPPALVGQTTIAGEDELAADD